MEGVYLLHSTVQLSLSGVVGCVQSLDYVAHAHTGTTWEGGCTEGAVVSGLLVQIGHCTLHSLMRCALQSSSSVLGEGVGYYPIHISLQACCLSVCVYHCVTYAVSTGKALSISCLNSERKHRLQSEAMSVGCTYVPSTAWME